MRVHFRPRGMPVARCLIVLFAFLLSLAPTLAFSQSAGGSSKNAAQGGSDAGAHPDLLDGSLSGKGDLEADQAELAGLRPDTVLKPWLAFKKQLQENYGLAMAGSYGVLWQNYSSSLIGQDNSVGGKFTLNAGYALLNRGTANTMWLETVIEDRRPIGTDLAPLQAGLWHRLRHCHGPDLGRVQSGRHANVRSPRSVQSQFPIRDR
jgi:porin